MGPNNVSPPTHVSSQRVRLANVKVSDLADMIAKLDGVRRTTKDELAQWGYRGRLVARQLDDTHIVIRADFDLRNVLGPVSSELTGPRSSCGLVRSTACR